MECAICLDKITKTTEYHGYPCNHVFHKSCAFKWMAQCFRRNVSPSCPICRTLHRRIAYLSVRNLAGTVEAVVNKTGTVIITWKHPEQAKTTIGRLAGYNLIQSGTKVSITTSSLPDLHSIMLVVFKDSVTRISRMDSDYNNYFKVWVDINFGQSAAVIILQILLKTLNCFSSSSDQEKTFETLSNSCSQSLPMMCLSYKNLYKVTAEEFCRIMTLPNPIIPVVSKIE